MSRARTPRSFTVRSTWIGLAFLVGWITTGALVAQEEVPSDQTVVVEELLQELERGSAPRREAAVARLEALGSNALESVRSRLSDLPSRVRADLLGFMGRQAGEEAIPLLIEYLDDRDRWVGRAARDALLDFEPGIVDDALRKALADGSIDSGAGRRWATDVVISHLFEVVEQSLRSKVTEDGSYGFYEGQFADLRGRPEEIGWVVLTIFARGAEHRYLYPVEDGRLRSTLDFLAGEALAEVVVPGMKGRLEELLQETGPGEDRREAIVKALHALGHGEHLQSAIFDLEQSIRRHPNPQYLLHDLASLYYRMGDHRKSIETYDRILTRHPRDGLAHYNKACSQVRLGDLDGAVVSLKSAWESGYDNLDWAQRDGDLAALRADPGRWEALLRWIADR